MEIFLSSAQKSQTLPVGLLPSQIEQKNNAKHIRSLSESKTTDGLTFISRTRFYSGDSNRDSNTSGVSSSDSAHQGIPSELYKTTNQLEDMNSVIFSGERFRRVSLTGTPIRDTSRFTDQDVHGYKKLISIRRNLRPMLSESAADDLADIYEDDTNGKPAGRSLLPTFVVDAKRKLHSRNIERQTVNVAG